MRILIAGASSALGRATARAARAAGHHVVAVGSSAERLEPVDADERRVCDLTSFSEVDALAASVGEVDALVHLVGGWRGGGGLAGQTDDDWAWLEQRIVGTLRNTTRAFESALAASSGGRVMIISTTGLDRPTAGNANYVALKAAAETWLAAVGHALRATPATTHAIRVKALVSAADREAEPDRSFDGYSDVDDVAAEIVGLLG
ncbi:SDR family NAD(P)-dependent oxidoreductase [Agrococcus sp. SGAir0287]|uniref:SDR family NAD(P)-dependent oxidoreductase n=1 Tax=Agrococcus sp. SGAir0287 TaxID=2070347 RepID=UPI0010CCB690|nr:SDR family NAD(P)-dependent oxidoreductase [Agrococcus sp. SGAir0287]QCR18293.1 alcohol dehydrogenase [Agrococcus sp. SGAir0287]